MNNVFSQEISASISLSLRPTGFQSLSFVSLRPTGFCGRLNLFGRKMCHLNCCNKKGLSANTLVDDITNERLAEYLSASTIMTMTNNNSSINDEAYEEAGVGVEIIAIEADADAQSIEPAAEAEETEESNDDTADNPLNKRLIMLWGLVVGAVVVVSYVASSSSASSSSSSKMTSINQMEEQPIKKGGFTFDYVGQGFCLDDNPNDYDSDTLVHGNVYPFVGYRYQADAMECAEVCAACPGKGQGGLVLRGFKIAVYVYPPSNPDYEVRSECFCLVDKSSIGTPFESFENIAYGVCDAVFSHGDAPVSVGTGEVSSFDYNPLQECWKVSPRSSNLSKSSSSTPSPKGANSSSVPLR